MSVTLAMPCGPSNTSSGTPWSQQSTVVAAALKQCDARLVLLPARVLYYFSPAWSSSVACLPERCSTVISSMHRGAHSLSM